MTTASPTERTTTEAELLAALKDVVRILEAMRFTVGLGKSQIIRLDAARAILGKASRS